jgi:hypothetical protein
MIGSLNDDVLLTLKLENFQLERSTSEEVESAPLLLSTMGMGISIAELCFPLTMIFYTIF